MSEFFYMVWYFIEQVATWTLFVLLIVPVHPEDAGFEGLEWH